MVQPTMQIVEKISARLAHDRLKTLQIKHHGRQQLADLVVKIVSKPKRSFS
jgi:hypothetical protein